MQSHNNASIGHALAHRPRNSVVIEDCYASDGTLAGSRLPLSAEGIDSQERRSLSLCDRQPLPGVSLGDSLEHKLASRPAGDGKLLVPMPNNCEMSRAIRGMGQRRWLSCEARQDQPALQSTAGASQLSCVLLFTDVVDRRLLEQQYHHSQKLESLGQLASGIAHEINNPLQYISDNIQFLKASLMELRPMLALLRSLQRRPECEHVLAEQVLEHVRALDLERMLEHVPQAVQDAEEGVSHVSRIVRAMKEFSHPGSETELPVNLNHILESTLVVSRSEWKFVADVETSFQPDLPKVAGYSGELHQIFLNLLVNAAHAIASANAATGRVKGRIRVCTFQTGDSCTVCIEDNGCGIPREIEDRIFEPFFTTKEIGKGTGQGLAIARRVVEKHGGSLRFESAAGHGTTFYVQLPRGRSPMA